MHAVQATFLNGRLVLAQPVDWPNGTRAAVMPLPPTTPSTAETVVSPATWPPGYFDRTAGALVGEILERPPQGDLPAPDN
jgi:hypothetical protein